MEPDAGVELPSLFPQRKRLPTPDPLVMFPPQLFASWVNGSGLGLDLPANHDRFFDVPLGYVVEVDVRFVVRVAALDDHDVALDDHGLSFRGHRHRHWWSLRLENRLRWTGMKVNFDCGSADLGSRGFRRRGVVVVGSLDFDPCGATNGSQG